MSGPKSPSLIDMKSKRVIITGANSGLGKESAIALAKLGAEIVLAVRDVNKGQSVKNQILNQTPSAVIEVAELDLMDLDSVRKFAATQSTKPIDVLLNNAGIMAVPFEKTKDGFESQMGTNHLGHFAFAGLIKDQIKDRLVVVSSFAHKMGNFGDNTQNTIKDMLLGVGKYQKWQVYGASKLANLLFVSELERLRIVNNWSFIPIAVHPGYSDTNLQAVASQMRGAKTEEKITMAINKLLAQPASAGALPTLAACVYPGLLGASFIGPDGFMQMRGNPKLTRAKALAYDQVLAKNLWQVSEELTKVSWS